MSATPIHFVRVFGNPQTRRVEARILCTGRKLGGGVRGPERTEMPEEVTCPDCIALIEKNGLPARIPYNPAKAPHCRICGEKIRGQYDPAKMLCGLCAEDEAAK